MQNEEIAIIALVVIIVGALSVYIVATNDGDIFENLFGEKQQEGTIEIGDCIDVNYIGKYASNGTVFDSSYSDWKNKSGGTPLKVFVNLDTSEMPPAEYQGYSSGIIEGLMEGLIDSGLKEGEHSTIGPISPEKAYGEKFDEGDTVNTTTLNQNALYFNSTINQTLEVTSRNSTILYLKWIDSSNEKFTMPSLIIYGSFDMQNPNPDYDDIIKIAPPFAIWKNATEIIETTEDSFITKTTPTKTENLTDKIEQIPLDLISGESIFIFPDATTVAYNETNITFTSSPIEGKIYTYSEQTIYGVISYELTVNNVTADNVNISILIVEYNQTQYYDLKRTVSYSRTFEYPRVYDMGISFLQQALPQFSFDLQREGYSLNKLAGESLIFEVTIEKIYKTSQEES